MSNTVIEALINRRSIRSYKSEQIKNEELDAILKAGTFAPSGRNRQSATIIAVQNKDDIDTLRKMNSRIMGTPDADPFYGAPTVLIVLADKNVPTYFEDGCLVMGNLMNAAHALGVDSCWIHRAREEFESDEGKALLKKWGVEGELVGIGHCILGYRSCDYPTAVPRKKNFIYKV